MQHKAKERESKSDRRIWWFQIFAFHFLLIKFQTCFIWIFVVYVLCFCSVVSVWVSAKRSVDSVCEDTKISPAKQWTDNEDYAQKDIRMKNTCNFTGNAISLLLCAVGAGGAAAASLVSHFIRIFHMSFHSISVFISFRELVSIPFIFPVFLFEFVRFSFILSSLRCDLSFLRQHIAQQKSSDDKKNEILRQLSIGDLISV